MHQGVEIAVFAVMGLSIVLDAFFTWMFFRSSELRGGPGLLILVQNQAQIILDLHWLSILGTHSPLVCAVIGFVTLTALMYSCVCAAAICVAVAYSERENWENGDMTEIKTTKEITVIRKGEVIREIKETSEIWEKKYTREIKGKKETWALTEGEMKAKPPIIINETRKIVANEWLYHVVCGTVALAIGIAMAAGDGLGKSALKTCSVKQGTWAE